MITNFNHELAGSVVWICQKKMELSSRVAQLIFNYKNWSFYESNHKTLTPLCFIVFICKYSLFIYNRRDCAHNLSSGSSVWRSELPFLQDCWDIISFRKRTNNLLTLSFLSKSFLSFSKNKNTFHLYKEYIYK